MADRIIVSSEEIQQCISKYRSALDVVKDAYSLYTKSLEALRSDWTGKAFAIMAAKAALMYLNISKSFNNIEDAMSELNAIAELAQDTENAIKGTISKQDVGNTSPFNAG